MLSIGRMAAGQGGYYQELAREDYYLEGGEPPGKWWGRGAAFLKLSGQVKRRPLERLLAGYSPSGKKLIQNAGLKSHRPGFDLTFSAPKSVSVLWSQAEEQTRREIQAAHEAAVGEALRYIEDEAAFVRRGKGGIERVQAGLVVAMFEHGTSRALDPQLHTHALVMNVASGADQHTGALEGHALYEHKMTAGAIYRAELAAQLQQRLGVQCEAQRTWFEIQGVPRALIDHFSKRRTAIEEKLSAKGLESASAAAFAALDTRQVKELVEPRASLFQSWQTEGRGLGFSPAGVHALLGRHVPEINTAWLSQAFQQAVEAITSAQSHFAERDVLRVVAEAAQVRGVGAEEVRTHVRSSLENLADIVRLGEQARPARYSTKEILNLEKQLLETAKELREFKRRAIKPRHVEWATSKTPQLNDEQKKALQHLTDNEGGCIRLVNGMAGTGKTTTLREAREAWERAGYRVQGVSLSGKAAKELQRGSGIESDTLAMLEIRMDESFSAALKHHAKQLVRAAFGKNTYRFKPLIIDKHTVLVVDEAGMLGTKQLSRLLEATKRGGGLLVLVGDRRQLQPIEAGGPFGALLDRLGHAELTSVIRQRDTRDQEAVKALARGEAREALQSMADRGLITVSPDRPAAVRELVSDWAERESHRPQDSLIFCGTNRDAEEVNRQCQTARRKGGALDSARHLVHGGTAFYEGDRVLFTKRSRALAIENGETGTIVSINRLRRALTVKVDTGERRIIPLRDYEHVRLGYAVTTHKGQGTTVERAYVLAGGPMQDRELSYVQLSRARGETRLYVDESEAGERLAAIIRQMELSRQKQLAIDAARTQRVAATR